MKRSPGESSLSLYLLLFPLSLHPFLYFVSRVSIPFSSDEVSDRDPSRQFLRHQADDRRSSDAGSMLIQRRQLQQRRRGRRAMLGVYIQRGQLLHRQQVRDLTGRAADREPWSPSFLLEAAAAAVADRRVVVQRYRVTVVAYLARQYRAVRHYYVAIQARCFLRSLRHNNCDFFFLFAVLFSLYRVCYTLRICCLSLFC